MANEGYIWLREIHREHGKEGPMIGVDRYNSRHYGPIYRFPPPEEADSRKTFADGRYEHLRTKARRRTGLG